MQTTTNNLFENKAVWKMDILFPSGFINQYSIIADQENNQGNNNNNNNHLIIIKNINNKKECMWHSHNQERRKVW